ncbi:unnamed protein product [Lactuca virosa]|uniref:Uncharacterized protein n=1 Tax=Lactuca virosa TaxID=75947 RepID=A0AAU9N5G1_9ASTR|nr:unnamed protein product [Lactuca virosa]
MDPPQPKQTSLSRRYHLSKPDLSPLKCSRSFRTLTSGCRVDFRQQKNCGWVSNRISDEKCFAGGEGIEGVQFVALIYCEGFHKHPQSMAFGRFYTSKSIAVSRCLQEGRMCYRVVCERYLVDI